MKNHRNRRIGNQTAMPTVGQFGPILSSFYDAYVRICGYRRIYVAPVELTYSVL